MINKIFFLFFGWLDRYSEWIDKFFIEKKNENKRRNKSKHRP